MTTDELDKLLLDVWNRERSLLALKGQDYSSDDDRLANFKGAAADSDGKFLPREIWWILFKKHIDAIRTWAFTGKLESEPLGERIIDARNYLLLGLALFKEEEQNKPASPTNIEIGRTEFIEK